MNATPRHRNRNQAVQYFCSRTDKKADHLNSLEGIAVGILETIVDRAADILEEIGGGRAKRHGGELRGNAFGNPAGLVRWLASKSGVVKLRWPTVPSP